MYPSTNSMHNVKSDLRLCMQSNDYRWHSQFDSFLSLKDISNEGIFIHFMGILKTIISTRTFFILSLEHHSIRYYKFCLCLKGVVSCARKHWLLITKSNCQIPKSCREPYLCANLFLSLIAVYALRGKLVAHTETFIFGWSCSKRLRETYL